jgi:hypothetical protein
MANTIRSKDVFYPKCNRDMLKLERRSYCVGGIMTQCSAGTTWKEQVRCKYAKKSTAGDRCMYYYQSLDGHCDCLAAQKELREMEKVKPKGSTQR